MHEFKPYGKFIFFLSFVMIRIKSLEVEQQHSGLMNQLCKAKRESRDNFVCAFHRDIISQLHNSFIDRDST